MRLTWSWRRMKGLEVDGRKDWSGLVDGLKLLDLNRSEINLQ